jgi:alpha-ketoglutaric semialdehyde dehydrogenase
MGYAGQKCTATSRVIVESAVYPSFRDRLAAAVDALRVLDPADDTTLVGPVIDEGSRASALAAVAGSGGRVLTGGKPLDAPGYYLAPTLVELDRPAGPLATEEVFAPVAALIRAETADEAVAIANGVRYGLVAAVFTSDLGNALRLTRRLDAGMIRVNAPTSGVDFQAPFGGAKESSYGPREQGLAARSFYTESRTLLIVP